MTNFVNETILIRKSLLFIAIFSLILSGLNRYISAANLFHKLQQNFTFYFEPMKRKLY